MKIKARAETKRRLKALYVEQEHWAKYANMDTFAAGITQFDRQVSSALRKFIRPKVITAMQFSKAVNEFENAPLIVPKKMTKLSAAPSYMF